MCCLVLVFGVPLDCHKLKLAFYCDSCVAVKGDEDYENKSYNKYCKYDCKTRDAQYVVGVFFINEVVL